MIILKMSKLVRQTREPNKQHLSLNNGARNLYHV